MMKFDIKVDDVKLARLAHAFAHTVPKELHKGLEGQTRRAAIYLCQSLRKRTKVAPKRIRSEEYAATPATQKPHYVHSNSDHHKLLRRWVFTRKLGMPGEYKKLFYVYTKARRRVTKQTAQVNVSAHKRRTPSGRMTSVTAHRRRVKIAAVRMVGKRERDEIAELVRLHGGIQHRGLAKKSWGWIARDIYNGGMASAGDLSWKHGKKDRRDPRQYVSGRVRTMPSVIEASLSNNLDYALGAMEPGAIEEAMRAAQKRLEHNSREKIADKIVQITLDATK